MSEFSHSKLPQYPQSYWRDSETIHRFEKLSGDLEVDTVIIGGGITGLTAAYLLSEAGVKAALVEAGSLADGTSGYTTAKVTAQHGLIYDKLSHKLGSEKARQYYQANHEALNFIKDTVATKGIQCEMREQSAYVYSTSDTGLALLEKEYGAYQKLGISGEIIQNTLLPFETNGALVMQEQADFHPIKYLSFLAEAIHSRGGYIFEHSPAVDIEEGNKPVVKMKNGRKITCRRVVLATHFPFYDKKGIYFARLHAKRSYALAIKAKTIYPGGMYINAETPKRSLRSATVDGEEMIIVGGESHKTGQSKGTLRHYEILQNFAEETFGIKETLYRWSAQDIFTLDQVPYIGELTEGQPNIFVATGYAKWGMTNGTAAAMLIKDLILEIENPYRELYCPTRVNTSSAVKFAVQNADVAKHFVAGKLNMKQNAPEQLALDEGGAVKINGKRAGAYRDKEGALHLVNTTCTHMGCELEWNNAERTWDCPCHASRFSYTGEVLEGPATKPLEVLQPETGE